MARSIRLERILRGPHRMDPMEWERDVRLLAAGGDQAREVLRAAVASGEPDDRVAAGTALACLRDEAGRDALSAVLADQACENSLPRWTNALARVPDGYQDVLAPWLLRGLDPGRLDRYWFAKMAGWLRVAAVGPTLLGLARVGTGRVPCDVELLRQAAAAWPSPDVSDEVRRQLAEVSVVGYSYHHLVGATVEIAMFAAPGLYEWALEWCWRELLTHERGAESSMMLPPLVARAPDIVLLLETATRRAASPIAAGEALVALARLDTRRAVAALDAVLDRSPSHALTALGLAYEGTGDPRAVELTMNVATARPYDYLWREVTTALARIGGSDAWRAAGELAHNDELAKLENDTDLEVIAALDSMRNASAPPDELADQMVRLGLVAPESAEAAVTTLDEDALAPYDIVRRIFDTEGILVALYGDEESDVNPPRYDDLVRVLVDGSGAELDVHDLEQTDEGENIKLSYLHDGQPCHWYPEYVGDSYDMATVSEIAEQLGFVDIGAWNHVFAEEPKLRELCRRTGIRLGGIEADD
jgi:hypothetical protein